MSSVGAGEDGFLTVQYVVVVALSLLLFTLLANLVVLQYGRGALRATLDEAARAGSRVTASPAEAVATCRRVAAQAAGAYLGGTIGREVVFDCAAVDDRVVATARAAFRGWLPGTPDWVVTDRASASREVGP